MELKQASDIAVSLCRKLQPHCEPERIHIAGSIKRKKKEVHDIEIVCAPKIIPIHNMFHEQVGAQVDPSFAILVNELGKIEIGKPDGRYMKILLPQNIKLDLFMPQPHDYFRIYAIRVGSKEYSAQVLAAAWVKNGWCGTKDGLRLMKESFKDKADVWHCNSKNPTLPPQWSNEQSFFEWLGVPWIEPIARNG